MIALAVIATVAVGVLGSALGFEMNFPQLGPVLSVATMGAFIMAEIRRKKQ